MTTETRTIISRNDLAIQGAIEKATVCLSAIQAVLIAAIAIGINITTETLSSALNEPESTAAGADPGSNKAPFFQAVTLARSKFKENYNYPSITDEFLAPYSISGSTVSLAASWTSNVTDQHTVYVDDTNETQVVLHEKLQAVVDSLNEFNSYMQSQYGNKCAIHPTPGTGGDLDEYLQVSGSGDMEISPAKWRNLVS